MLKKMTATFTAVVAALAVVGVSWAGTDDGTSTSVTSVGSTGSSIDDSATTVTLGPPVPVDSTPSTSVSSIPSTTADDDITSTTLDDDVTSTSVASSTSTSLDDSGQPLVDDGQSTYRIPGVGTVTIAVTSGRLSLVDVSAPGWSVETEKLEIGRIELEFSSGESEAEFEARIEGGRIEVEIEVDSD